MRFRIDCSNPDTRQHHQFELEAASVEDAKRKLAEAGMVARHIEPVVETPPPRRRWTRQVIRYRRAERRRERIITRFIGYALIGVLITLVLGAAIGRRYEATDYERLKASVRYDGASVTVVNTGAVPWHNVRFDLNGDLANAGDQRRVTLVEPGETVVLDAAEPLRLLRIYCDLGEGRKGLFNGRFD